METPGKNPIVKRAKTQVKQNRQPLKLECKLKTLSTLTLSEKKKELLKESQFYPLAKITNKKESSSTLVGALCLLFDGDSQIFILNEQVSFRICAREIADALGIKNTGKDFQTFEKDTLKYTLKFPEALFKLREEFAKADSKKKVTAKNLKTILNEMSVEEEVDKTLFVQLFCFYVIEQFLLCGGDSGRPRCSLWKYVVDLKDLEDVNWAKATHEHLIRSLKELKKALDDDKNRIQQHCFKGCAPILEAIIYDRIPSLFPKTGHLNLSPPIQKYASHRTDFEGWQFSRLTPNDVNPCSYCTPPTPRTPRTPLGSFTIDLNSPPSNQVIHSFESMHVTPLQEASRGEEESAAARVQEQSAEQEVRVGRPVRKPKPVQKWEQKDEFSLTKCMKILEGMEGVSDDAYMKAIEKFKVSDWREIFVNMSNIRRIAWLDRLI